MSRLIPAVQPTDHSQGNDASSLILVEYGDYECPHCGRAHPLLQRLLKEFKGQLRLVYRNFPLQEIHPNAYTAALAAEAAGLQGKFWEMHDLIFENQRQLSTAFFPSLAERLALNMTQFNHDWKSQPMQDKVEADFDSGVRSGVNGTPGFFLQGKPVIGYDETYDSLRDLVMIAMD